MSHLPTPLNIIAQSRETETRVKNSTPALDTRAGNKKIQEVNTMSVSSIALNSQKGKVQSYAERWQRAQQDGRCQTILLALLEGGATNPLNSMSYRQISRKTSIHHNTVRRLIAGDKKCKSKLMGLVRYPEKNKRSGCYLTPEGKIVAEKWAKGETFSFEQLRSLAESQQSRRNFFSLPKDSNPLSHYRSGSSSSTQNQTQHVSHLWHTYGTPSFSYSSYMQMNECSLTAESEKLERYGIKPAVARDLANRYSPQVINAAIVLRERRNGAIYNPAGFIVWLLKSGCAERFLRECHSKEKREEGRCESEFEPIYYRKWREVKREIYGLEGLEEKTKNATTGEYEDSEVPHNIERTLSVVLSSSEQSENGNLLNEGTEEPLDGVCERGEVQDCCLKCGQKEEELNKRGIFLCVDGICTACKGMELYSHQCADCGLERDQPFNEVKYREDFDLVLCRKCWLKRVKGKLIGATQLEFLRPFPS